MELELDWDLTDFGFCCDALEVADEGVGVEMDSVALLLFSLAFSVAAEAEEGAGEVAVVEAEATDEAGEIVSCWLEDMLGCWLLASTWTTDELLSLSSSAVTSSLELEVAEAVWGSLRLEIFILAVPLTTSMNLQKKSPIFEIFVKNSSK